MRAVDFLLQRPKRSARWIRLSGSLLLLSPFVFAASPPAQAAGQLPPGFSDTLVVQGVGEPMDGAFTPDGRMLVAVKTGQLRVVANGALVPGSAVDLSSQVCTNNDRGLLGVAVDPQFATNSFIYLFWTHKIDPGCAPTTLGAAEHRISRYVLRANNTVDPSSARVIADHIPSLLMHQGGDLQFGKDGFLYASIGNGACVATCGVSADAPQRPANLLGKVIRIKRDGGVPPSNPYAGAANVRRCARPSGPQPGSGPCAEVYALGFRNPFKLAVSPTGLININDVGADTWEEVSRLTSGGNYGWPICEGAHRKGLVDPCNTPGLIDPIAEYNHSTGCRVVTGGAFVPKGVWGMGKQGSYFFNDYSCGRIWEQKAGGAVSLFATDFGAIVSMTFGPFRSGQALFYLANVGTGEIHAITSS